MIVCLNADTLATFAAENAGGVLGGRYVVGLWFWEVEIFPEAMRPSLDLVDEVWVASEFNREVLVQLTDKPVRVVPLPVHVSDQTNVVPPELETERGALHVRVRLRPPERLRAQESPRTPPGLPARLSRTGRHPSGHQVDQRQTSCLLSARPCATQPGDGPTSS